VLPVVVGAMDVRRMWRQRRLYCAIHLLLLLELCGGRSGKLSVMARRHRNKGNQWWSVYTGYSCISLPYSPCGGSVAEWLACWTQAQKGPGSNHSRDAVG